MRSAAEMPDIQLIDYVKEPLVKATIIAPIEYAGSIKTLCADRRGEELSATAIEGRLERWGAVLLYKLYENQVIRYLFSHPICLLFMCFLFLFIYSLDIFASFAGNRMVHKYRLPLNEIIVDFYDSLKSVTSGFASFDYDADEYVISRLVRVDFLINRCVSNYTFGR